MTQTAILSPETDATGDEVEPMLFGFAFDEEGKRTPLSWSDVSKDGFHQHHRVWIHLNRTSARAQGWLRRRSKIEPLVIDALLQEDTRPRATRFGNGFLINLRGFNLNPGDALDDMVSVRMWATTEALITLRSRPVQASMDVRQLVESGVAPPSTGGLVALIATSMTNRMEPEIAEFDEQADTFDEELLAAGAKLPRSSLANFRRRVLTVRRYILPQREALAQLAREGAVTGLLAEADILQIREAADRVTRLAEDLDAIRERTNVLQEQIMETRSDEMNERLFILSLVSAIFLPISFVTGLFGVNIDGMPGMENPYAFSILVGGLVIATLGLLALFRWRHWI